MSEPPTPCKSCRTRTTNPGGLCDSCKRFKYARYERNVRSDEDRDFYQSTEWQILRQKAIVRAGGICEYILEDGLRCHQFGNEVDHKLPREMGGPDKLHNLQLLCKSCHSRKTLQENRMDIPRLILVCGPPGAGKTTYVLEQKDPHDIVIDFDYLRAALLLSHPHQYEGFAVGLTMAAREAIYRSLSSYATPGQRIWVIETAPTQSERNKLRRLVPQAHCQTIIFNTPVEECKRRIVSDTKRSIERQLKQKESVDRWWKAFDDAGFGECLFNPKVTTVSAKGEGGPNP